MVVLRAVNNADPIHRTRITDFCAKSTPDSETTQTRIKKKTKQVCGIAGRYLSERFSASNMELLKGLSGLDPSSSDWLNFDILNALIERYSVLGIRPSILRAECLKMQMADIPPNPASTPNIMKLMDLKRTIAPTSCEAERSFSTMNRVKTAKRSKLSDGRTSDLVLLSHEKVLTKAIDIGKVIDKFAEKPRRVVLK